MKSVRNTIKKVLKAVLTKEQYKSLRKTYRKYKKKTIKKYNQYKKRRDTYKRNKEFKRKYNELNSIKDFTLDDTKGKARMMFAYCEALPIDKNLIMYEASAGVGMVCNPYAIFKAAMANSKYRNYKHLWVIEDESERERLREQYKSQNIRFTFRNSKEYIKGLATAKYIVNNTSFPTYFSKKEGQIIVNTWHSTTVKTLCFDCKEGRLTDANVVRCFMMSDYIVSPNRFMTDIFKRSYKLDGLYRGKIIEEGYPRNDVIIHGGEEEKARIIKSLAEMNIDIDPNKKLILYAPTWRGNRFSNPKKNVEELKQIRSALEQMIGTDEYQILVRPHYAVYRALKPGERRSFVPATVDACEVLCITDILITDYSSIAFDFMNSGRPILYYMPDLSEYEDERGIYFKPEELPGPVSDKLEQIAEWVGDINKIQRSYKPVYQKFRDWVCEFDDGKASEKIIDIAFNGNHEPYRLIDISQTDKKKLLIYGGHLQTNGVTNSLLYWLNSLDYSKFDITLITPGKLNEDSLNNMYSINENVRVLYRQGAIANTYEEEYAMDYLRNHKGMDNRRADEIAPIAAYRRDLKRCVGDAQFDYVLDYSGYGMYYPMMIAQADGAKKFIWQHNDLYKDGHNSNKKKQARYAMHGKDIRAAISTYPLFDKVISTSKSVMEINKEHYATEATADKYTYVTSLINANSIKHSIENTTFVNMNGALFFGDANKQNERFSDRKTLSLVKCPDKDKINFVTIGRLSAEKNHVNLIKAFAKLSHEYDCHLYIIGAGDLEDQIWKQIQKERLQSKITMTGRLDNAAGFMKLCDCFIFVSYYEALCMAVLEARTIGLPMILAKFDSVKDVLMDNGQILVEHDAEDIYRGMVEFINDRHKVDYDFDVDEFNRNAMNEFLSLFD